MSINNEIYSQQADGWWDENHFLHLLKTGINPARFAYFHNALTRQLGRQPQGLSVLDVGCGGGILSEEFAKIGCRVTGLDPSAPSLETARSHAAMQGLTIDYRQGSGEDMPFEAGQFDVVVCCDVLEHVNDLEKTIREAARVVKPGGIFCYDTINRTEESRKANIFAAQNFPLTSFFPKNTHVWEKFITPGELLAFFEKAGFENRDMTGLNSALPDLQVAGLLIRRKLGLLTFAELGRRLQFQTGGGLQASYLGWAIRKD
ncbi:MAG: bifunctional 2-polyprenyl-6-hydroxyphenol methylase/3-demethylubiquinol 3-O-methyltransferase UbiG [Chloroflexi bacterium]|nr:bifunctional 2-polyprenyl-6-hydroxyphenol methylase/3-demethylubiquinol 3-O-methyltransferase UbiG [Chloroflexota bacterium]